MKYIESNKRDPYFNLALEEYVFERLSKQESYFILWQNDPSIIIGKYQNTIEEINEQYVKENKIAVVRRLSGGGAVYHDKGNLNYTFIVDKNSNFDFNFNIFVIPVIETLKKYGIEAEFSGRNDIEINKKKFCGNSQFIKGNRILHHGCIMLNSNLDSVKNALKVNPLKVESKSTKSVRSRVTTINENAQQPILMSDFKESLLENVFKDNKIEKYELTEDNIRQIEELKEKKYSTWEWNYGHSPEYTISNIIKFNGGIVSAKILVEKGTIEKIKFYGDFFGNGDIKELERNLEGIKIDNQLKDRLNEQEINYYINRLNADELYTLIKNI